MSQLPDEQPLKEPEATPVQIRNAPEVPLEYIHHMNIPFGNNGNRQITEEEWKEACKHDKNLLQIQDFIEQDRALIALHKHNLAEIFREVKKVRSKILRFRLRIEGRQRQYKHFAILLRKRMAAEKIAALRKELNL